MIIDRCYNIVSEDERLALPDFDCQIDCGLEWDHGIPVVRVDDVLAPDWKSPLERPEYFSLFSEPDALFRQLGTHVAALAEADEDLLEILIETEMEMA